MACSEKQNHHENDQETEDRISNLPDALLCHILSFIPTKSAVATSILSRRWISLWTKVPALDFSNFPNSVLFTDNEIKQYNSIIKKVLLHNDTPCLQRLDFEALLESDIDRFNSMVNSLLKREIWEIHLKHQPWEGRTYVPMQLPTSLFVRDRLVVLKISGPFRINVPLSLNLPRLERLNFHYLKFVGQDVLNIVTSGCSAIKELVIEYCSGLSRLYIDSLTLTRLRATHISEIKVVKGPNIRFLDVQHVTKKYDIGYLGSLVEATIHVYPYQDIKESWTLKLIRRLSHVQTLRLSCTAVALLGRVSENKVPMFPNLTCLEVQIAYGMFRMIENAPKLMRLIVDVGMIAMSFDDPGPRPSPPEIVPQCLLSLRTFEVRSFGSYGNDILVARYVLKNATALKELKIHMHRATMECQRDAHKMLLSYPRISNCQVIVCSGCRERNTFHQLN